MEIQVDGFTKQGLYLQLENGRILDFSRERINALGEEYWNNPEKMPESIKQHDVFKTCSVCPYRGQDVFCSAFKPLLPFIEEIELFSSCDRVTAVYVDEEGLVHVSKTSMAVALQYLTNMSIFEFCEDLKLYRQYFKRIMPFLSMEDAVCTLFLNVYWMKKGNREEIKKTVSELHHAVNVTSTNCVDRLYLMCESDVFRNAYVRTHCLSQYLGTQLDFLLEEYFETGPSEPVEAGAVST